MLKMKFNATSLLLFLIFMVYVKANPCIPTLYKTKTLPTQNQLKKRYDAYLECAAKGGNMVSSKQGCLGYTTFCSIKPGATASIGQCKYTTKTLPVSCMSGEVKTSSVIVTYDRGYKSVCKSTSVYCTKSIPNITTTTTTTTTTNPCALSTKAINPICTSGQVKTSSKYTYSKNGSYCTDYRMYCSDVITTTPIISGTIGKCPSPATKTLPLTCNGGEIKVSSVYTSALKSGAKSLCTGVTTYCTSKTLPIPNITTTTTTTTTTTKPIITTIGKCSAAKTLPVTCSNGIKTSTLVTATDGSGNKCTSYSTYCSKTVPYTKHCALSTKTIMPTCTFGQVKTSSIYTLTQNGSPCTAYHTYCSNINTPTPIISGTIGNCPGPATKTLPLVCKSGEIRASSVYTSALKSGAKSLCTGVTTYCTSKTLPIPNITTTTTTTPNAECIPITITVTEKNIETITEKDTVTVTVIEEPTSTVHECASKYEQCGGKNFNGPTCCESGTTCHKISEYYSQCY